MTVAATKIKLAGGQWSLVISISLAVYASLTQLLNDVTASNFLLRLFFFCPPCQPPKIQHQLNCIIRNVNFVQSSGHRKIVPSSASSLSSSSSAGHPSSPSRWVTCVLLATSSAVSHWSPPHIYYIVNSKYWAGSTTWRIITTLDRGGGGGGCRYTSRYGGDRGSSARICTPKEREVCRSDRIECLDAAQVIRMMWLSWW